MDMELLKVLAPYITSILGAVVAIGIAVYNNSSKTKAIQNKLSVVDQGLQGLKGELLEVDKGLKGELSEVDKGLKGELSEVDRGLQGLKGELSEVDRGLQGLKGELSEVDKGLQGLKGEMEELKENHFSSLGKYLRKLNAFLHRGKLMDDVEKADMDSLADGVAGKK